MEFNDQKLKELLQKWEAPPAPRELFFRVFPTPPWWRWLWTGSIRVPVPVGLAALVVLGVVWFWNREPVSVPQGSVSLADFHPVDQLEPRIIRGVNYEH